MAARVVFRRAALQDVAQYERWRSQRNPEWQPIAEDLLTAIHRAVNRHASFNDIPAPRLVLRGETRQVKRLLVTVRSKPFRVYVGPGRRSGEIEVRRVRHPGRRPIEG